MAVTDQMISFFGKFDKQLESFPIAEKIEAKTKVPKSYAVSGIVGVYFLLLFLNIGGIGQLLSNIVGFAIPAYFSIQAIETTTKDDDTKLLTYWVVFAFLNVAEFWSSAIIYWIPFYWLLKTVFLVYIALPFTNGATVVYNSLIAPVFVPYVKSGVFYKKPAVPAKEE